MQLACGWFAPGLPYTVVGVAERATDSIYDIPIIRLI